MRLVSSGRLLTSAPFGRPADLASPPHPAVEKSFKQGLPQLISREQLVALEAALDEGSGVVALRRFNKALRGIPADKWGTLQAG